MGRTTTLASGPKADLDRAALERTLPTSVGVMVGKESNSLGAVSPVSKKAAKLRHTGGCFTLGCLRATAHQGGWLGASLGASAAWPGPHITP